MYIMATWWKPWTWGEAVGDAVDALQGIINRMLVSGTQFSLDRMTGMFNGSINALQEEVAITPTEFSADLVETLQNLSTTVLLPVAGLIITYVFGDFHSLGKKLYKATVDLINFSTKRFYIFACILLCG